MRIHRFPVQGNRSLLFPVGIVQVSFVLFFIYTGDAILSFWAPNLIEESLGSATHMGIILGFSSLIGLFADLVMPQLMRNTSIRRLILLGGISGIFFSLLLLVSHSYPLVPILLLAMAIWGIYYEFLGFAIHEYIAERLPAKDHASSWAIFNTFRNLAYFMGPLIAAWVLLRSVEMVAAVPILFVLVGVFLLFTAKFGRNAKKIQPREHTLHPLLEMKHWRTLYKHVWPIILISLAVGVMDAVFWSVGAVWTEKLAEVHPAGFLFLPMYTLPSLVIGFAVAKWGVYQGKKKIAELFLFSSGASLMVIVYTANVYWQLLVVLVASTAVAVVYPLSEAVYSDIIARMGREKKELIGLSRSSISIAYILGPIAGGMVSDFVGERLTFAFLGLSIVALSFYLLVVTPRKLKLPQTEIKTWE